MKAGRKPLPLGEKKISRHFKFSAQTIAWIEKNASKLKLSNTGYIERLIEQDNS